jgi:phosphatidate cytidylyltransferase
MLGVLIWAPSSVVTFFFLAFIGLSVFEFSGMMIPALESRVSNGSVPSTPRELVRAQSFCIVTAMLMFLVSTLGTYETGRGGIAVAISVLILVAVFSETEVDKSILRMTSYLATISYGCIPWLAVWDLYAMGGSSKFVLLAIAIVMLNDTGAYIGGRKYGKTQLAPTLSPKKTREGAVIGVVCGIVGAVILNVFYGFSLGPTWVIILCAVAGGPLGILGDLVESAFKRFAGIKDSGAIFPGHGGFLDRVDSLLFAAPGVWFVLIAYRQFSEF